MLTTGEAESSGRAARCGTMRVSRLLDFRTAALALTGRALRSHSMSLDEAYKVFGVASSIAVIISLAFAIVQLRKATQTAKSSVYQNIFASLANLNAALAQGKDSVEVYIKGRSEVGEVRREEVEKGIFGLFMSSAFNLYESLFYQHDHNLLDRELWGAWDKAIS